MILIFLVATPLIGAIMSMMQPTIKIVWRVGLVSSVLTFTISMFIWLGFNPFMLASMYQYTMDYDYHDVQFGHISLGIDAISIYYVLLTTIIIPICILSGRTSIRRNIAGYVALFLILESLLCIVFLVKDIILFYVFFESVLIPLFIIVGIYGKGKMRVRASYMLFLYTLFGSLAILLAFVTMYYYTGTTDIQLLLMYPITLKVQKVLFVAIMLSIIIKTPLIPFNTWLTYAHSEAPVGGSIILAGVILKLATYGYLRIVLPYLPDASNHYGPMIQILASISIVYASLSTIRQTDFKKLVAYSSVAHIGVVVLGVFSGTIEGIIGAYLLSLAHGLVSPALFYLVGGNLYERYHTRTIRYYRGLTIYMPVFSLMFFVFTISNAAVPLTANWMGEFMVISGVYQRNVIAAVMASTSIVLSAVYSVWLYSRMCFGSWSPYLSYTKDLTRIEFSILLPLLIFTVLLGVYPNFILNDLYISISSLQYNVNLPI